MQKTAYELRISDWSSDVCSSDLIGKAEIEAEQVERYLTIARAHKVDAVLTISNQFVALPTHSPLSLPKASLRGVELFHWSWMHLQIGRASCRERVCQYV